MPSVDEILNGAKFPTTTVDICMRQDLNTRREELLAYMTEGEKTKKDDKRFGQPDIPELVQAQAELDQLEEEMIQHTLTIHMTGISSAEYNSLQRQSGKPRDGNRIDLSVGFNLQNFYAMLIKRCTMKVTSYSGDSVEFTPERWKTFLENITDAQFDLLGNGTKQVNRDTILTPTRGQI